MTKSTKCRWSKNGVCIGEKNAQGKCGFIYPNEDACAIILGCGPRAINRKAVQIKLRKDGIEETEVIYTNEKQIAEDLEIYRPDWTLVGYNELE